MSRLRAPGLLALALLLAPGCDGKGKASGPPGPGGAGGAGAVDPAAAGGLRCDAILPDAIRARHLEGAEIADRGIAGQTVVCAASRGAATVATVSCDCRPTSTLAGFRARAEQERRARPELAEVPGLGRAAWSAGGEVRFYDDDADCELGVTGPGVADPVALARDVAGALGAAMVPARPRGKLALDCERLLPPALRAEQLGGAAPEPSSSFADALDCAFADGALVKYDCRRAFDREFFAQMRPEFERQGLAPEDVAAGAAAVYLNVMGLHQVVLADAETSCQVTVLGLEDKARTIALARAAEAALTVESSRP